MKSTPQFVRQVLTGLLIVLCLSPAVLAETETETQTWTTGTFSGGSLRFSMVSVPVPGSSSYPQGSGSADIQVEGEQLAVHFQAEGMANGAHLTLFLSANGTSHSVANMTTSYGGEVEGEATVALPAGTYAVGLTVIDTSSFASPTLIMGSNPTTAVLGVSQGSQTTTFAETTQVVSTYTEGETEDDGIRTAIQQRVIPAVVDVGEQGSTVAVNDGNFSVSVGRYQEGYLVSISASNVTGPRVLLINLTSSYARGLFSGPVLLKLDGASIQQGSTFSQVLGATSGDPARFVLISDPSSLSLLVSIPHFSYHTIAIIPVIAQAAAVLLVYLPAVFFSVAAVTLLVVVAYSRRTRAIE